MPRQTMRPAHQTITIKSEKELMEEMLHTVIRCGRTSITFGWNDLAGQLYQAESILEKMVRQN